MIPIVLVSGDFVRTGGMDMANLALASFLARRGHEVHVVSHRVAAELLELPTIRHHPVPKPLRAYLLGEPLLDLTGRRVAAAVAARGGRVVVNGGNCSWADMNWVHYVHAAHGPLSSGNPARRMLRELSHAKYRRDEHRIVRRARLVVTNSERTKSDVIEYLQLPPERVRRVYYGCDAKLFPLVSPDERARQRRRLGWNDARAHAVFVGALGDRRKGFDSLYEAWRSLCSDPGWDMDLIVIGAGHDLAYWISRARIEGLDQRIRFLGFRNDVPEILAGCDLLVHPARYEAYGIGVQEALCRGLPALVSRGAGVAEQYPLPLRTLLLDDPDDIAALVGRLRSCRERLPELTEALRPFADRLRERSWDIMSQEILGLLDESGAQRV